MGQLPVFENDSADSVGNSLGLLSRVCLGMSSASSATSICASIVLFIHPESTISSHFITYSICGIIGLCIAFAVDFMLVQRFGNFFFREVSALFSKRFDFRMMRGFNMLAIGLFFAIGFYISYVTSSKGAIIVASAAGISDNKDAQDYSKKTEDRQKQHEKMLKPYRRAKEKVEKEIATKKRSSKSAKLKKLYKNGNEWAIEECDKVDKKVDKQFASKLRTAQKDYNEAKGTHKTTTANSLKALTAEAQSKILDNKARFSGLILMLQGFGVLPLFAGVLLIIISAIGDVNAQISKLPTVEKKRNTFNTLRWNEKESKKTTFGNAYGEKK